MLEADQEICELRRDDDGETVSCWYNPFPMCPGEVDDWLENQPFIDGFPEFHHKTCVMILYFQLNVAEGMVVCWLLMWELYWLLKKFSCWHLPQLFSCKAPSNCSESLSMMVTHNLIGGPDEMQQQMKLYRQASKHRWLTLNNVLYSFFFTNSYNP